MHRSLEKTQTPGIYRRGDRYVIVMRDRDGRQFKRFAQSLAEARALKATLQADLCRGEIVDTRRLTFAAYSAEWVRTYQGRTATGVRAPTLARYRRTLERDAIPFFGRMQLADIGARDIKRYATEQAAKGLSRDTVRLRIAPLRALFGTAVEDGLLRSNPAAGLRMIYGKRCADEIERKALSEEELARVIANAPEPHRELLTFLAETGLRISEAIALDWRDVDLVSGRVSIRRRFSQGTWDVPKSRHGIRSVPLSDQMCARLAMRQPAELEQAVFATPTGSRLDASNLLERVMKPAAAAAGVPWAGLHTLRHTCASRLFRRGWNAKQVQMMLGHHSPAFTLATYVHVMPDELPTPSFG